MVITTCAPVTASGAEDATAAPASAKELVTAADRSRGRPVVLIHGYPLSSPVCCLRCGCRRPYPGCRRLKAGSRRGGPRWAATTRVISSGSSPSCAGRFPLSQSVASPCTIDQAAIP